MVKIFIANDKEMNMKNLFLILALIISTCAVSFAQQRGQAANGGQKGTLDLAAETVIQATLQSTIDAEKAKVGDKVLLKTTKAVKQNGETVIAKGSNVVGRITEVSKRSKENATSKIGMVIDRVEGQNLSAPITASIVSITDLRSTANVGDTLMTDTSGSSRTSTTTTSSGGSGGLLGGGGGGLIGGVGSTVNSTVGTVVNTSAQTIGGVTNTAGRTLGTTTGAVGRTLNGIQISNSASGSANSSTTLSSNNKNVRLEKGVTFNLAIDSGVNN